MVNEVTLSASMQKAAPVVNARVPQQPSVKEVKEVESSRRQEHAVSGKDMPQSHSVNANENAAESTVNVMEAVQRIQDYVQSIDRDLDFRVDDVSGRTIVSVIDPETEEVVRQIPSEEIMNFIHHLQEGGGFLEKTEA